MGFSSERHKRRLYKTDERGPLEFVTGSDAVCVNNTVGEPLFSTIMAGIRDGKISTTFNYKKIRAVTGLDLPALVRPHSGGGPSVSSVSISIRRRGTHTVLKRVHFVNAVRHDESLRADVGKSFNFEQRR